MEKRHAKRIMALMPEEEPVFIRLDGAQYMARLINLSACGALLAVRDCDLECNPGDICQLLFASPGGMFRIQSEVMRKNGRYAAFRFVEITPEKAWNIAEKIARMEHLTAALTPVMAFEGVH